VASVAIAFHLFAVGIRVLATVSGPWPNPPGFVMATPPQFAFSINEWLNKDRYLDGLKLTDNYHFFTNHPKLPGVYLEIRLLDDSGDEIKTVKLPDDGANPWVRYRQSLLARALADDQLVILPPGEAIAAAGQTLPDIQFWHGENRNLKLRSAHPNLVPRDQPVFRPAEWSLLLTRSYARHLCRLHGAASAEIIRHSQEPIPPLMLFNENVPPVEYAELICNFGKISR
jgi:hypothetical protein